MNGSDEKKFFDVLLADVDAADERLKSENNDINRRTLIRAFFSLVEGSMYVFRRRAISGLQLSLWCATVNANSASESDKDYGFHKRKYDDLKGCYRELAALDDITLKPDKTGVLREGSSRSQIIPLVALSLRAFARHQRLGYDCGHRFGKSGWRDLKTAVAIRNRLTHPKQVEQLAVSDKEIKILRSAMQWFSETVLDIAQAHKRGLRAATKKDLAAAKASRKQSPGTNKV
jgi:hypothetical protein